MGDGEGLQAFMANLPPRTAIWAAQRLFATRRHVLIKTIAA